MLLTIPEVLSPDQTAQARLKLVQAEWVDGRVTAGYQSARAKNNMQVPETHPVAREIGTLILDALGKNPFFHSAALPRHVYPPIFNRYEGGQAFGTHVDGALRQIPGTPHRVRTDISATLFITGPDEYEGGELCVEDTYGVHAVKLPAGHMVLYPGTSLHHVNPVTRGMRMAAFFWIQSVVRDDGRRTLLFDLDLAIQRLNKDHPEHPSGVQLVGVYNNLLRQWAEV